MYALRFAIRRVNAAEHCANKRKAGYIIANTRQRVLQIMSAASSSRSSNGASASISKNSNNTLLNPFHLATKIFDLHLPYLTSTLHLQIELALWICTLLLTAASSLVLYKHSYLYTGGDWVFLSWVGLWLGRHFLIRLICTVTWVDTGSEWRGSHPGSWRRRHQFSTWMHRHQGRAKRGSLYHRLRWIISLLCSPYTILCTLVKLLQTCAMAGQYCDTSAANGVASAAMLGAGGGGGGGTIMGEHEHHHHGHHHGHHHHSSNKSSSQAFFIGPYPHSNDVHTAVILSMARSW